MQMNTQLKELRYDSITEIIRQLCKEKGYSLSVYAFGSGLGKFQGEITTDYDMLVLGSKEEAECLKKDLANKISEAFGAEIPFRESMLKKNPGYPYIHFQHYKDEQEWLNEDGPAVINSVLLENEILYGQPLQTKKIPITNKTDVLGLLERYLAIVRESGDDEHKEDFFSYVDKTIFQLLKNYPQFKDDLVELYEKAKSMLIKNKGGE